MSSIEFILNNFKIPPRYNDIGWNNMIYLSDDEKSYSKSYVDAFPNNGKGEFKDGRKESIYLSNNVSGAGKTSYAICLTYDLIKSGKLTSVPLFVGFRVLMDLMRQDKESSFLGSDIYKKIMKSSFIIFDDVGAERFNASIADRYLLLLEQLWSYKKPAIFTSKYTLNELVRRGLNEVENEVLESIASRLVGMCDEFILSNQIDFRNMDGKDNKEC